MEGSSDLETLMQGRIRQKMDVYANDVFSRYSSKVASSRLPMETILHSGELPNGRYTLLYAVDGGSPFHLRFGFYFFDSATARE